LYQSAKSGRPVRISAIFGCPSAIISPTYYAAGYQEAAACQSTECQQRLVQSGVAIGVSRIGELTVTFTDRAHVQRPRPPLGGVFTARLTSWGASSVGARRRSRSCS
jgi:hypothetical protein